MGSPTAFVMTRSRSVQATPRRSFSSLCALRCAFNRATVPASRSTFRPLPDLGSLNEYHLGAPLPSTSRRGTGFVQYCPARSRSHHLNASSSPQAARHRARYQRAQLDSLKSPVSLDVSLHPRRASATIHSGRLRESAGFRTRMPVRRHASGPFQSDVKVGTVVGESREPFRCRICPELLRRTRRVRG